MFADPVWTNNLLQGKLNLFRAKDCKNKECSKLTVITSRLYSVCLSSHFLSVLKHLHSSWDAGRSLIVTSHFCFTWCQGKGLSAVQEHFFLILPALQEHESFLNCLATPALFSAAAKHLCHSLDVGCCDASALSPCLFQGHLCYCQKEKVILTYLSNLV